MTGGVDERSCHEFIEQRLKGKEWKHDKVAGIATWGRNQGLVLSPLDMNTLDSDVAPHLHNDHFEIDLWTYEAGGRRFGARIHGYRHANTKESQFLSFVRFSRISLRDAFYSALTEYLASMTATATPCVPEKEPLALG